MKEFQSCKKAISSCLEQKYFAVAHLYQIEKTMDMHIHDSYELYYSISGGKQFLIDNHFYSIHTGDIFFINPFESHHLTHVDKEIHERIVLSIHPDYLTKISSPATDLNYCFTCRKNPVMHKLTLNTEDQKRFMYFISKICDIKDTTFGRELLEQAYFTELMVFLNKRFDMKLKNYEEDILDIKNVSYHQTAQILAYINQNITSPLTLEELSEQFFLSPSYLCRIFKAATGTTINKYIIAKRVTIAKERLTSGCTVYEACELSGFHDYSNFLKTFTKAVGISPKKYSQFSN